MRITVIGSSELATEVTRQARGHGHDVTTLAGPLGFERVADAVAESSSVIVAIEPGRGSGTGTFADVATIIHAMAERGVYKLVVVTAAGAFARSDPALPLGERLRISTVDRSLFDAIEDAERRVMASDLEWTIVRPMRTNDGPFTGEYRFTRDGSIPKRARAVSRADVAAAAIKAAETDLWYRKTVTIAG